MLVLTSRRVVLALHHPRLSSAPNSNSTLPLPRSFETILRNVSFTHMLISPSSLPAVALETTPFSPRTHAQISLNQAVPESRHPSIPKSRQPRALSPSHWQLFSSKFLTRAPPHRLPNSQFHIQQHHGAHVGLRTSIHLPLRRPSVTRITLLYAR